MKVVINKCFGGFSLSEKAIFRYAEIKGLTLYPEKGDFSFVTYYLLPKEERVPEIDWKTATTEERVAYNKAFQGQTLYDRDIDRADPALVKTVEELGTAANGGCAELRVVEIPDGVDYEIKEYDGLEHVAQVHRTWG